MKAIWITLLCLTNSTGGGIAALQAQGTTAKTRLDSLERVTLAEQDAAKKTDLLNTLSFEYLEIDAQKTKEFAEQAFAIAEKHGMDRELGRAYNNLACHAVYQGETQRGIAEFERSITYYEKAGEQRGVADVLGNIGNLYYFMGNFPKALDYSIRALRGFEKLDFKLGIAKQHSNIGSIYMELGDYSKAIHYDSLALHQFEELDEQDIVAMVLGNLANIYSRQKKTPLALEYFQRAIDAYKKTGNPTGIARNLTNQSTVYQGQGDYASALASHKQALEIFQSSNNPNGVCYTLGNIGVVYWLSYKNYHRQDSVFIPIPGPRQTLLSEAAKHLSAAVEMAQQREDMNALNRFGRFLSEAYQAQGDVPKAFDAFKLYVTARDSAQSIDTKREIEKLTTAREMELMDKQIELDRLAVEKKRNERLYFGIGIGLLLVSMLFVYRNYDNQKKSNVRLAALNTRVAETNTELANKNAQISQTLQDLKDTQEQLVESEKQKEKALIRSRISQDIHDDISSGLTKISWLSESFLAKAAQTTADIGPLVKINDLARDTVNKLGEIIWSSNPDRDNLESLLTYMRRYIAHYLEDTPIRQRVDCPETVPDIPLNPELRRNLYLVLKEALHNARKYSQAKEITVSFALDGNKYRLEVGDNGVGMEPDAVKGGGNGMLNMRRRMEAIGGQMQVESEPGKGTKMVFEGEL